MSKLLERLKTYALSFALNRKVLSEDDKLRIARRNNQNEVYRLFREYYIREYYTPFSDTLFESIYLASVNRRWKIKQIYRVTGGEVRLQVENDESDLGTICIDTSAVIEIVKKEERNIKTALNEYLQDLAYQLEEKLNAQKLNRERQETQKIKSRFIDEGQFKKLK